MNKFLVFLTLFGLCYQATASPNKAFISDASIISILAEAEDVISQAKSSSFGNYQQNILFNPKSQDFLKKLNERNDETALKCLLAHNDELKALQEKIEAGVVGCALEAKDHATAAVQKVIVLVKRIYEVWNSGKTIIDDCVTANTDATSTLKCIDDKARATSEELISLVVQLKDAIIQTREEIRLIGVAAKVCVIRVGQDANNDLQVIGSEIIKCINEGQ